MNCTRPARAMDDGNTPLVLVADDDAAARYLMRAALIAEGYGVVEARDGREAVASVARDHPDAVLMDVEMPGVDGYTACSAIRESDPSHELPIVMVTGLDDPRSIDRAYQIGATDFIVKPINWRLIGHRLRYILRNARNRQALSRSEGEKRALLAAIPDLIFVVDAGGTIRSNLSGSNPLLPGSGSVTGRAAADVLPSSIGARVALGIEAALSGKSGRTFECKAMRGDGAACWFESRYIAHGDDAVLLIVRDVSERKAAEERIHFLAYYDALTRLPNRAGFAERAQALLDEGDGEPVVLCITLDRFKRINDTLGATIGNAVLKETGAKIRRCLTALASSPHESVRGVDWTLACLGGEEFAVLLSNPDDSIDIGFIGEHIKAAIAEPLAVGGHEFVITASIGAAAHPQHGEDADALIRHATVAKDVGRGSGESTCSLYRSSMSANAKERLDLESDLRQAINDGSLRVFYQPKFCTARNKIAGAEALLRWEHPIRGEISPTTFIPIAEETGLIIDIGRWLANTVCQQVAEWDRCGISAGATAINVSGREFAGSHVLDTIVRAAWRAGVSPSRIQLEITESVLVSEIRSVLEALNAMRDMGFSIAVDDFGTGYSSLRYLQKFPVDVLKIDRSFIVGIENDLESKAICGAIVALAKSLSMVVVGEGVENECQLDFLRQHGCDYVQGFMLGRPMAADEFAALLAQSKASRTGDHAVVTMMRR